MFTPEKLTFDSEKAVFEEKEISIQKLETYIDEADTTKIIRNNIEVVKGKGNGKYIFVI